MTKFIALLLVCLGLNMSAYARSSADDSAAALQVGQDTPAQAQDSSAATDATQAVDKTNTTTDADPSKDKDPEAAEGVQSR